MSPGLIPHSWHQWMSSGPQIARHLGSADRLILWSRGIVLLHSRELAPGAARHVSEFQAAAPECQAGCPSGCACWRCA